MARVCVDSTYFDVLPDGRLTLVKTSLGMVSLITNTTAGVTSFTKASYPNATRIRVITIGAGGGGAGATCTAGQLAVNGGGGGGGYSERWIPITSLAASETVTVGAGGAGGIGANNGDPGNASSFGTWCVANGGNGGPFVMASGTPPARWVGGTGAAPGTGDVTVPGMNASSAVRIDNLAGMSGRGGDSGGGYGSGGLSRSSNGTGNAGIRYGGGGSGGQAVGLGGSPSTQNGGAGAVGAVFIEVWN
jgi:hypothetical protein